MKKQLVIAGAVASIGIAGVTGIGVANAETTSTDANPHTKLVDAIASKFNINKDEVEKVFDEQHATMQAERNAKTDESLAKLVSEGKLTQAQADALKAKRAELEAAREANKPDHSALDAMTEEQRKAEMEKHRTEMETKRSELEAWAKEQGIDTQYLRYAMGGDKGGREFGNHGGPRQ